MSNTTRLLLLSLLFLSSCGFLGEKLADCEQRYEKLNPEVEKFLRECVIS